MKNIANVIVCGENCRFYMLFLYCKTTYRIIKLSKENRNAPSVLFYYQ